MQLTVKQLKHLLNNVDDSTYVHFQHIADEFLDGRKQKAIFHGQEILNESQGWTTVDMPCDTGCLHIKDTEGKFCEEKIMIVCTECPHRSRYITASGAFIKNGEIFIDGHY